MKLKRTEIINPDSKSNSNNLNRKGDVARRMGWRRMLAFLVLQIAFKPAIVQGFFFQFQPFDTMNKLSCQGNFIVVISPVH